MFIADFHIHSKYSRATSRDCVPEMLELWARRKGLDLIGTGDFTHPVWREELKEKLAPAEEGLYALKGEFRAVDEAAGSGLRPRFIVSGEISSIYKKNGRVRKVHNLILLPSLEEAEVLSRRLEAIGNLHSDGRPILGLDSRDLLEITLETAPDAIFIPAHIWTPHFSLFGAYSGFDDIHECFEDLTGHIHALETGLSSDPPMNWRLSALDGFTLISNSDAHSPANLAREANLFDTALSYPNIARALADGSGFCGTIEFFPEEGKYHYDGHRNCKVCLKPSETVAASGVCPVCGGRITVGVLHRVEALADRAEGFVPPEAKRFESLVPLHEVVASSLGLTTASKKAREQYDCLVRGLGPELYILREAPLEDIAHSAGSLVAEGIRRLRCGKVNIEPGYDGEYGRIKIFDKSEISLLSGQLSFLSGADSAPRKDSRKREAAAAPVPAESTKREETPLAQADAADIPYGLNREQWEAVSASDRAVAVIAGPGTGKTKTLVSRIAHLVEQCGIQPAQITAVTFTNKAAKEMRDRLEKQFGDSKAVRAMTIGTFHSICLKFLTGPNNEQPVTVIDEQNALAIVSDILKRLGFRNAPRDVLRGISLAKSGAAEQGADVPSGVYEAYCAALAECGAVDFDDILLRALDRFEYANQEEDSSFRHILVDEFQDINPIQYRLIKAWCRSGGEVFVIGDPDQSIYGFRGSDPRCFQSFLADFSPVRQIQLTQNYRSTPEILRCAQAAFIRRIAGGHPLEANKKSGVKVRLLEAEDAFSEALFVAKEINRMVGGIDMLDAHTLRTPDAKSSKWGFSDIAVLYRTNRQALALEQCLLKESIPYVVAGRDDFLSDPQVRRAVAFFRFLLNPEDIVSLRVCMESYIYKAGAVQKLLADYAASEKTLSSLSGILEMFEPSSVSGQLSGLLQKYAPIVHTEAPWKLLEAWMRDHSISGLANMEMLVNTSVMHSEMAAFLQNLALGQESDVVRSGKRSYTSDAVTLTTLHGAKGLEYPAVFLCGVTDGLIPYRNHAGQTNPDEERRLFYVGMTRAKDELTLLTSRAGSPFLDGLPEELLVKGNALPPRQKSEFKQLSLF